MKKSPFKKITSAVFRKKVAIQEIVREPTSGGIIFRFTEDKKDIEVLLIQDSKNRWTIPKGHIEPGETAKMTARREIEEETGLKNVSILTWLGKIHFKYRRSDKLVLMTTQIYLVQALDDHELPTGEKWMKGIQWFSFADAVNAIEYEDMGKLIKNVVDNGLKSELVSLARDILVTLDSGRIGFGVTAQSWLKRGLRMDKYYKRDFDII